MILSPFFISGLFLCVPYLLAAYQDLHHRTVSFQTWRWLILAVPSSLLGWYEYYHTSYFDPRIFLLLAGFIAAFFIGLLLYTKGKPSIGGGDILAICIMLLFIPVLPELGWNIIYIFPLCVCSLIISLYWNTRGKEIPFIFPFALAHTALLISATFI